MFGHHRHADDDLIIHVVLFNWRADDDPIIHVVVFNSSLINKKKKWKTLSVLERLWHDFLDPRMAHDL